MAIPRPPSGCLWQEEIPLRIPVAVGTAGGARAQWPALSEWGTLGLRCGAIICHHLPAKMLSKGLEHLFLKRAVFFSHVAGRAGRLLLLRLWLGELGALRASQKLAGPCQVNNILA